MKLTVLLCVFTLVALTEGKGEGRGSNVVTVPNSDCGPGNFVNTDDDSCNPCPLNTYSSYTGATACQSCLGGSITHSTGAQNYWDCVCPAGEGRAKGYQNCKPCAPGSYNDGSQTTQHCILCPEGHTSSETGARDDSGCTECREGYRRDADSGDCVVCPRGTYSDKPEAGSCTSCPEGETTLREGTDDASFCHSCAPGTRYVVAFKRCVACPTRSYNTDGKTDRCTYCPHGYTTARPGASSADQCSKCYYGYIKNGDKCEPCPIGTRTIFRGGNQCYPCPEGATTNTVGSTTCTCLPGHRWDYSDYRNVRCIPCPIGTYRGFFSRQCLTCPAGTTTTAEAQTSVDDCE